MSEEPVVPLEDWIDEVGLRGFVEKHLKVHMDQWQVDDPDGLIRLAMISLRQELREAGWTHYEIRVDPAAPGEDKTTMTGFVPVNGAALVVPDGSGIVFRCGCGREMKLGTDKREEVEDNEREGRSGSGDDDGRD